MFAKLQNRVKAESDIVPSKGQDGAIHTFPEVSIATYFILLFEHYNTDIRTR